MPAPIRLPVVLIALLSLLPPGPAAAQQGWKSQDRGGITGAWACPLTGDDPSGNFQCHVVDCASGALRYGFDFVGGEFPPRVMGRYTVDGQIFAPLTFVLQPVADWQSYRAPHDPARDAPLLAALRTGRQAMLTLDLPTGPLPLQPVSLAGSTRALVPVERACAAVLRGQATPTPTSHPDRFVRLAAPTTPRAEAEARALLAGVLADNDRMLRAAGAPTTQRVAAVLGTWPDGRQLLLAEIGHDTTAVYGQSGGATHLFAALPGGPWKAQLSDTALTVWLDRGAAGRDGWPDLMIQPVGGGFDSPIARWSWDGGRYVLTGRSDR